MAGRGSLLDKLKLQKLAEQRKDEAKEGEQQQAQVSTVTAAVPQPQQVSPPLGASAVEKPKSFGRGTMFGSIKKTLPEQPSPVSPPLPTLTSETEKSPEPTRRLPSIERSPEKVPQPTTEVSGSVQKTTASLLIKGRGIGIKKTSQVSEISTVETSEIRTLEPQPPIGASVLSKMKPPPPTIPITRISPTPTKETAPTVQAIKHLQAESAVITAIKTSSHPSTKPSTKSDTSTDVKSQPASEISHKTMEKAIAELKIEEIKRTSPLQKFGTSGTPSNLTANYIKLKCKNAGVYQYVVHYHPPCESRSNRMRMLQSLRDIIGPVRLFDGMTLFLPIMLKDQVTMATAVRPTDHVETTIKIQLTKILPPEQIPPVVFNIIFRSIMNELKMKQIGQHFFNPQQHIPIPAHRLDIWPGYITAVHEFSDGLYLVADVSHKVIRSETCWQILNDLRKRNSPSFKEEAMSTLIGCVVLTPYNNRTYRIDDILWDLTPESKFTYHDKQEWSYVQYYKQHYGIEIEDVDQPLLLNRAKKSKSNGRNEEADGAQTAQQTEMICLIPELCCLTGLTDEIRKDFRVMKELANHTRVTPNQRYDSLRMFIENIRNAPNALKHLTNWGLELDDDTVTFNGRLLPRETIYVGRNEQFPTTDQCDWNYDIGRKQVLRAVDINNWIVVFTRNNAKTAEKFCECMFQCSKQMGIRITEPVCVQLNDDRTDTYIREIKSTLNEHIQMVVIIFPTSRDDRYAAVKRLCCIDCPVPSQCIIAKTIFEEKKLRSVTQKILLQMNCKLGGELWRLNIPIQRLMVIGIDVYHQIEKRYKSIAGFVSSLNNDQTRWYSKVCFQMIGQELVDSLKVAFTNALKQYQEVNNSLPDKIVIFRDGVGDGQLNYVSEHEVEQLRTCFGENYTPKLGVVIVQKRINARIFGDLGRKNNERELKNPEPGTIVDHTITRKELYDFFLVSQHVRQGTVTPTHYIVVFDDTQFQPDHMQRLSYKLTHLYYNWPGTIRVPAPCQVCFVFLNISRTQNGQLKFNITFKYAHKLAYLTGQHLQKEPNAVLCNRLFYL